MMILYLIVIIQATVVPQLLAVAFLTLVERRVIGAIQRRVGPNAIGAFGILQPFLDGQKLLLKEPIVPSNADQALYYWAPVQTFQTSQIRWARLPTSRAGAVRELPQGAIYVLAVGSQGVYGIQLAGWSRNSRYAFQGCCRSVAQIISYEQPLGLIVLTACLFANSLNQSTVVESQSLSSASCSFLFPLWPIFVMWIVCSLAELNRAPIDLPEAEAELVAGYNVEYASIGFALFFIREYRNMILIGRLTSILFLGGGERPFPFSFLEYEFERMVSSLSSFLFADRNRRRDHGEQRKRAFSLSLKNSSLTETDRRRKFRNSNFLERRTELSQNKKDFVLRTTRFWLRVKTTAVVFLYIWVRATLPRYKYSQLIAQGWKRLLPQTLAGFVANAFFVFHVQMISEKKMERQSCFFAKKNRKKERSAKNKPPTFPFME